MPQPYGNIEELLSNDTLHVNYNLIELNNFEINQFLSYSVNQFLAACLKWWLAWTTFQNN